MGSDLVLVQTQMWCRLLFHLVVMLNASNLSAGLWLICCSMYRLKSNLTRLLVDQHESNAGILRVSPNPKLNGRVRFGSVWLVIVHLIGLECQIFTMYMYST